jgi:hypothetical protein
VYGNACHSEDDVKIRIWDSFLNFINTLSTWNEQGVLRCNACLRVVRKTFQAPSLNIMRKI